MAFKRRRGRQEESLEAKAEEKKSKAAQAYMKKKNEAKANPLILQGYLKTYIKKKKRLFSLPEEALSQAKAQFT